MHTTHGSSHRKCLLAYSAVAFFILVICIATYLFYYKKPAPVQSQLVLFNDLRSEYLDYQICLDGKAILESPQDAGSQSSFSFPSENGEHILEATINSKTQRHKFSITEKEPKYIYISFADKSRSYINYFFGVRDSIVREKVGNTPITRKQWDSVAKEVVRNLNLKDLESAGYNTKEVHFKVDILNEPYRLN